MCVVLPKHLLLCRSQSCCRAKFPGTTLPPVIVSNFINVDERFIHVSEVTSWRDTLTAVKEFLKTKARQGFTATIIMLCVYTEYGLVLPSGQTVPVEILEREIQLRLNADQVLPRAVNLVIVEDGQYRQVSHIQSEYVDRIIRRFKIM